MKHTVLIVSLAAIPVLAGSASLPVPGQAAVTADDDRKVLLAVINHTVRPEVQRLSHLGPSTVLYLIDRTLTRCDGQTSPRSPRARPFCMPANNGSDLRDGKAEGIPAMRVGPIPADVITSDAQRDELVASYQARNSEARPLPVVAGGDIELVSDPPALRGGTVTSYTVFSLPGYSSAGFATLHAFYDCSGRCGTTWRWLLEKRDGEWQVRARYVTGMF